MRDRRLSTKYPFFHTLVQILRAILHACKNLLFKSNWKQMDQLTASTLYIFGRSIERCFVFNFGNFEF